MKWLYFSIQSSEITSLYLQMSLLSCWNKITLHEHLHWQLRFSYQVWCRCLSEWQTSGDDEDVVLLFTDSALRKEKVKSCLSVIAFQFQAKRATDIGEDHLFLKIHHRQMSPLNTHPTLSTQSNTQILKLPVSLKSINISSNHVFINLSCQHPPILWWLTVM